ncbi:MAG TPA: UDP-N-acetylglucosamine 2-epimerase, partial [Candidatus Limnocylindrales bacterium]|nr:UDP-N-acetylglucosamine 2-epimerase [Candidatus Limnocylindrales bacterium]
IRDGVVLVGDLMQDLAARVLDEVRDPSILGSIAEGLGAAGRRVILAPGSYLFATIHRHENRAPDAIDRWVALLRDAARPDRPVILALHPGTRLALGRRGDALDLLGRDVVVVEPLGYRTSLALQLHAAAVLTDSGGVQREAGWLGVPCLVLRSTTEWPELLDAAGGTVATVGLDGRRVAAILGREAPRETSEDRARQRAAVVRIEPAGVAETIAEALRAGPT